MQQPSHCAPIGDELPLVDTNTHQHGKAGKQNCDATPPTRTAACHFVLPRETGVVHARYCARHRVRCTHGTHACAWNTHAPPIYSSAALAAPRCRDHSSATSMCENCGRGHRTWQTCARRARVGSDIVYACHTYCIEHCCFLPHLLLLLALQNKNSEVALRQPGESLSNLTLARVFTPF